MSKAALVCAVMGPEKAREDLLSYLVGKKEDMDQVLLALSKSLAHFFPYIGGPDHCHLLIPLFEKLLNVEETMVRSAGKRNINFAHSNVSLIVDNIFVNSCHFRLFYSCSDHRSQ